MKKKISFEEGLLKLEELVANLESGSLTLDESISVYKESIELAKFCSDTLEKAKQEVEKIDSESGKKND